MSTEKNINATTTITYRQNINKYTGCLTFATQRTNNKHKIATFNFIHTKKVLKKKLFGFCYVTILLEVLNFRSCFFTSFTNKISLKGIVYERFEFRFISI